MSRDQYPINYHVLAEDFRDKEHFTPDDGRWLLESLRVMCDAYDEQQENAAAGGHVEQAVQDIEQAVQIAVDQDLESTFWGLALYNHLTRALVSLEEVVNPNQKEK